MFFNCLCNLKHYTPFKDSGLQVLQPGSSHGVADPEQCCIYFLINYSLHTPLPLLQGLVRAGGGSRVHIFCVMFMWGHRLPTFNTFPLHPSVLKPYFDLGDKKEIITYCLSLSCINRPVHIYVHQQTDILRDSRRKGERNLTSLSNSFL